MDLPLQQGPGGIILTLGLLPDFPLAKQYTTRLGFQLPSAVIKADSAVA